MQRNNTFIIAQEGWKYLLGSTGALILFTLIDADLLQSLAAVVFIASAYIYRNPERIAPHYQKDCIISPVDGRVTGLETVEECPGMDGSCHKLTIRTGCFDTSLLRIPFTAGIEKYEHRHGGRLSLKKKLARELNEKALITFSDEQGHKLVIEHLLEQSPDVMSLGVSAGQQMTQGVRYGVIVKGTHTLYLPKDAAISLRVGDKLRAGESLLGYFS